VNNRFQADIEVSDKTPTNNERAELSTLDLDDHDDMGGLTRDLPNLVTRRRALALMGGLSLAGLAAACGSDSEDKSSSTTTGANGSSQTTAGSQTSSTQASGTTQAAGPGGPGGPPPGGAPGGGMESTPTTVEGEIPNETAGPYPADGSNGPNFLTTDGIDRSDITKSTGEFSGTADGVAATIELTLVDAATGDAMPDAAVYLWHCTATGQYSIYEIEDQNYLRGVQVADKAGKVTFKSVFPGCYAGRWPHCHFEVFASVDEATAGSDSIKTSQLALPQANCETVYESSAYGNSASNLGQLSLSTDGIFSDGWDLQLATVSGSVDSGLTVSLLVRV
jgi:protocatechuate 3,4-dioxygenase beta subunit